MKVWNEWQKEYVDEDDLGWEQERCDRCDAKYSKHDGHGIEDCIRSLADRVMLLFEQKR